MVLFAYNTPHLTTDRNNKCPWNEGKYCLEYILHAPESFLSSYYQGVRYEVCGLLVVEIKFCNANFATHTCASNAFGKRYLPPTQTTCQSVAVDLVFGRSVTRPLETNTAAYSGLMMFGFLLSLLIWTYETTSDSTGTTNLVFGEHVKFSRLTDWTWNQRKGQLVELLLCLIKSITLS